MARNRKTRTRPAARLGARVLWLAVILAVPTLAPSAREDSSAIRFKDDLFAALRQARAEKAVTVLLITTPDCSWCRKMSVTTLADREVRSLARRFVWVKLNGKEHPELMAQFGIEAVPFLALLNVHGQTITARAGYIPPSQMAQLLRTHQDQAETVVGEEKTIVLLIERLKPSAAATATGQPAPAPGVLEDVVAYLARPQRYGRGRLVEAVRRCGPVAWAGLCDLLADKRLAVRAAAGEALAAATRHNLPFDPFADAPTRSRQIAAWREWIERNKDRPTSRRAEPAAAGQPTTQVSR